ncbi:ChaN family lipoprotein [Paenirhodobacter sp.]|uniref:ChaN family lipoprotein n=1 Tax=Paenirhodobacter sp. TaxID=1965326 RepID=UPI003B3DB01C
MKMLVLSALVAAAPVWAEEITADDLAARIGAASAQVLVLGEVHDNPDHHRNQAAAIVALRPKALVFEMLTPEQAARATPGLMRDSAALEQALGWEGWPDFAMYAPIFAAAPQARVYGAALPRAEVRRAMTEPLAQVFPEAARYGIDKPYPKKLQAELEAAAQADHCDALPPEMLPGMVAAQRLRDAAFADATLRALRETGGPVALITGSGHARTDRAVPAMIAHAAPEVSVLSIGQREPPVAEPQPFDLWIVAPAPEREDPCKAFR